MEGFEKKVLEGLDLNHWKPWIVIVEALDPVDNLPIYFEWEPILCSGGYDFVYFDELNRFYLSAEKKELAEKLSVPPNVFDNFISIHYKNALDTIEFLQK